MISLGWTRDFLYITRKLSLKVDSYHHLLRHVSTCQTWLMFPKCLSRLTSFLRRYSWCIGVMILSRSTTITNTEISLRKTPRTICFIVSWNYLSCPNYPKLSWKWSTTYKKFLFRPHVSASWMHLCPKWRDSQKSTDKYGLPSWRVFLVKF